MARLSHAGTEAHNLWRPGGAVEEGVEAPEEARRLLNESNAKAG